MHKNTLLMMVFYELVGDVICRLDDVLLLPTKTFTPSVCADYSAANGMQDTCMFFIWSQIDQ